MPPADQPKGPASYFPSIEKTYGQPIAHWLAILDGMEDKKHMEQVALLKSEHQWATVTPMRWWRFTSRARAAKGADHERRCTLSGPGA